MKNCLLAVICLLATAMANAQSVLYVSPAGSASNPGTSISAPTTLVNAIATVAAGGTIYLRGGTYNISATVVIPDTNNGTASARKSIVAYDGEAPVLDFSAMATADANRGLVLDGDYWNITGITISGAGDNGMLLSGNNNNITNCIFKKNKDTGLQLSRYKTSNTTLSSWPSNNLILNCEAFDNQDPGNENADGFAAKLTCGTGNIFRNCISHHNIDDGWDFYAKSETGPIGPVTLEGCIAYSNGSLSTGGTSGSGDKNGFKLGGSGIAVNHIVRRCIAFGNGHHGFTDNDNPGNIEVTNNTSYNNAESNYNFRTGSTATFRNNISLSAGASDKTNGTEVGTSNVWWKNNASTNSGGLVISAADFVSVSGTVTRAADGTPQLGNLFALAGGSDMIDAGVTATGITYSGAAPDLGARESGGGGTSTSHTLTTNVTPAGGGTVSRSPNNTSYAPGTVVTLTATPASGYTFSGWSGGASGTAATATVTMNGNTTVTAAFTASGSSSTLRIDDAAAAAGGYCSADGSRQNSYAGAYGGYYINLSNSAAKGVNYAVNVSTAGAYTLQWGYANGGSNVSTTARVLVNGTVVNSNVQFPVTSSWSAWSVTGTVSVPLAAGNNTIRLETTEAKEFANIDWMEVSGAGVSAGSCGAALATAKFSNSVASEINANIYPNPAAANATLSYTNPKQGLVWVGIYGANGVLLRTVQNKVMPAGRHQLALRAGGLQAGSYVVRVMMGQQTESVRLVKQ